MLADQSKYLSDRQKTQNSVKIRDFKHKIYDFYSLLRLSEPRFKVLFPVIVSR